MLPSGVLDSLGGGLGLFWFRFVLGFAVLGSYQIARPHGFQGLKYGKCFHGFKRTFFLVGQGKHEIDDFDMIPSCGWFSYHV